ncbi:MAG TPA: TonB-dependent siderophore receptor [Candidatus Methylacidiphilales bacterium]
MSAGLFLGLGATGGIGAETTATTNTAGPAASAAEDTSAEKKETPVPATAGKPAPRKNEESPTTGLDEIVVNARSEKPGYVADNSAGATKTGTPLIETPQSVAVITRDQMDERNTQSLGQIVRYTPGVASEVQGADRRNDSTTYIRGFSADRYLDGLKLFNGAFTFPTVEPYFLQSAEVLYGPTSVLYGNASPGGILNLTSRRPEAAESHEVQLQIGNNDLYQGAFDTTGPLDKEGKVLYRVSGLGRTQATGIDHTSDQYQRLAVAPAITWLPDPETKLTVLVNVMNDPHSGFFNAVPARATLVPNPNGTLPRDFFAEDPNFTQFRREQYSVGFQFERKLGDTFTVRQNFRYLSQQIDYADIYPTSINANLHTINRDAFHVWENQNGVALDNQAQAKFETGPVNHTVLAGLDYQNLVYAQRYVEAAGPSIDYLNPVYAPVSINMNGPLVSNSSTKQSIDQIGLYAQDELAWDRWRLTLGGREDWYAQTTENRINGAVSHAGAQASTMRTGLLYKSDIGLSPYFSYAQSFQPASGTDFGGKSFLPTRGEQEEAGLKYKPKAFDALFTLAFYNLDQTNVLSPDPAHAGFNLQSGKVRSQGTELSMTASPAKGFNVTGGYSYTDNRILNATGTQSGTVGMHPATQPANRVTLWGDYTLQDGPLRGFGLGSGMRYVGSSWADNFDSVKIPDYMLFDAGVHYDFGPAHPSLAGLRAAVNISNLFDRTYIVAGNGSSLTGLTGNAWYGEGRTIQGILTYKW